MTGNQSSYRDIFKATSLFGGVQVSTIIIRIIRSKFVAVLLGPQGMGIAGLLNSTISLIAGLTNFGLGVSAIKNVAAAKKTGDANRIAIVVTAMHRWVWLTGLLGTLVCLVLSSWLSQITFGNQDYTLAFIWISITLLFSQLSNGQLVLLQGLRKLQYLAKANLLGAFLGLVISVPIYFVWGLDGIVPAIILSSATVMSLSWYFARKVKVKKVKLSYRTSFYEGKEMLKMGILVSLSGLLTIGSAYLLRIFISNTGGIEQVGLFTAGFAIINTYVGMIFNAMSTDYYPRLSGVADNNNAARKLINQQAEVAILIMAPLLAGFFVYIKLIVFILYSEKFLAINAMIYWAAFGMFFKAASWSMAMIFLAKSESRIFLWNELVANIYFFALNILGYYWYGLTGWGISFLVGYIVYTLQVYLITRSKYEFRFGIDFIKIFSIQFIVIFLCYGTVKLMNTNWAYITGSVLILVSVGYSFWELDKRLDIRSILSRVFNKKNRE